MQPEKAPHVVATPVAPVGTQTASHRIAGLDLIRGFAIALVIVRHAWPQAIGSAGVVEWSCFLPSAGI